MTTSSAWRASTRMRSPSRTTVPHAASRARIRPRPPRASHALLPEGHQRVQILLTRAREARDREARTLGWGSGASGSGANGDGVRFVRLCEARRRLQGRGWGRMGTVFGSFGSAIPDPLRVRCGLGSDRVHRCLPGFVREGRGPRTRTAISVLSALLRESSEQTEHRPLMHTVAEGTSRCNELPAPCVRRPRKTILSPAEPVTSSSAPNFVNVGGRAR